MVCSHQTQSLVSDLLLIPSRWSSWRQVLISSQKSVQYQLRIPQSAITTHLAIQRSACNATCANLQLNEAM